MSGHSFFRPVPLQATLALLAAAAVGGLPQAHAATNLFNVYAGAAYARSNLRAKDSNPAPFNGGGPLSAFSRSDAGYQFSLGVRGLELLGAEVDYFDLGSGSVSGAYMPAGTSPGTVSGATLSQKGEAAFAMLYLPVPIVDIYLKAGVDRIASDLGAQFTPVIYCPIGSCRVPAEHLALHATTTGLALGAGAQWQFGNWGIRAEYERFTALGEHPDLVSVGIVWTFL
ncbi:MAG: outer membrane beta-barrel protein [Steroidobacteraceae bacterium]